MAITLKIYHNQNNNEPFTEWLEGIRDKPTEAKIRQRLRYIGTYGNLNTWPWQGLGDYKVLKGSKKESKLYEFRIHDGPGYRIYWSIIGRNILLLLRGGIRREQNQDIQNARADFGEHQRRRLEPSDYSDFI